MEAEGQVPGEVCRPRLWRKPAYLWFFENIGFMESAKEARRIENTKLVFPPSVQKCSYFSRKLSSDPPRA